MCIEINIYIYTWYIAYGISVYRIWYSVEHLLLEFRGLLLGPCRSIYGRFEIDMIIERFRGLGDPHEFQVIEATYHSLPLVR